MALVFGSELPFAGALQKWAESLHNEPRTLLVVSLIVDVVGMMSFLILLSGQMTDMLWAPLSGLFLHFFFGSFLMTSLGCVEELLPFTDLVPSASAAWALAHCESLGPLRKALGICRGGRRVSES
mmetsp:Transcript_90961/g.241596  ORF Transcript_90961/g.241596 Transcript_90961/m.241596 type:complete len:125 (-) Transcript_90961:71-445(-)